MNVKKITDIKFIQINNSLILMSTTLDFLLFILNLL